VGLIVVHPGTWSTVQDLGRPGYRSFGVPVSGPCDTWSHGLANALVANPPEAATVELTMVGGQFRATTSLAIALAGAAMLATVERADGRRECPRIPGSLTLRPGDQLLLGGCERGLRTYLAVAGGWQAPLVLGSRSSEVPLGAGDCLQAEPGRIAVRRPCWAEPMQDDAPIRVIGGPDSPTDLHWEGRSFRVATECDRMGLRLEGPAPEVVAEPERLSGPLAAGAVQVAGGRLLILGVAGGTMGGYPHVAHVVTADLRRLGQARPGDRIAFRPIPLEEARALDREDRQRREDRLLLVRAAASDQGPAPAH